MPSFPTTPLARFAASAAPVHALAFSAGSGQYLLAGSADRSIRLYNPSTSRLIQTYSAHGYEVLDLAVSADNAQFVSGGGDKTVFLWDVATAQTLRRLVGHAGRVQAVAFGGEGGGAAGGGNGESIVVSGSFDGSVKCWDLRSRSEKAIQTFSEARDGVSSVSVLGADVYAGSTDGRVRVYDLRSGCVDTDVFGTAVTSVTPARDGQSYVLSTLDSACRLMDRETGKCLQTFKAAGFKNDEYRVRSTLATADAAVISGSENGSVFVWDVLSGDVVAKVQHMEDSETAGKKRVVSAVAWNQVRKQWASAAGDGSVIVWATSDYWNTNTNAQLQHPTRDRTSLRRTGNMKVAQQEINSMFQLAKDGNTAAVDFLRQTPRFREQGARSAACLKILKDAGNERAGRLYDNHLRRSREIAKANRARRMADAEELATSLHPSRDNDAMETSETANEHEDGEVVEDVMDDVEDEQPQRESPVKIKVERLTTNIIPRNSPEDVEGTALNTHSVETDTPDLNDTSSNPTAFDHDESSPMADLTDATAGSDINHSQTLYDPTSPPQAPEESIRSPIAIEFALRKLRAEAGSLRESRHLDRLALEAKIRALELSALPEFETRHPEEKTRLQLKLSLAEADATFYGIRMELVDWQLKRERDVLSPFSNQILDGRGEVLQAQLRKAWFDAEVAFAALVLAFPGEEALARPSFPSE